MTHQLIASCAIVMLLARPSLTAQTAEDAAQAAAESWVRIVDAGDYGLSWEEAATAFKGAVTQERWTEAVARARAPLGALSSRKVASRQATDNLPGAPAGNYVVIQFTAVLEKSPAVEAVTLMLDGDRGWRIVGYFIKPS